MKYILSVIVVLVLFGCTSIESTSTISPQQKAYQEKYLSDPTILPTFKSAITNGRVEIGMCPGQVFAAIGLPGPYMVQPDVTVWDKNTPPPIIVMAQDEKPDNSKIELIFHNKTHFQTETPIKICVQFEKGKVVSVKKGGFSDI